MAFVRHVGLELIPDSEGTTLQMRRLIDMQAHVVAGPITDDIVLPLSVQHVAFHNLGAGPGHRARCSQVDHGANMTLLGHMSLDLVTDLERASLQMGGLINMHADFMAGRVMHGVKFSLALEHVPFDQLGVSGMRKGCYHDTADQREQTQCESFFHIVTF